MVTDIDQHKLHRNAVKQAGSQRAVGTRQSGIDEMFWPGSRHRLLCWGVPVCCAPNQMLDEYTKAAIALLERPPANLGPWVCRLHPANMRAVHHHAG